jgi:translation initiation factor 1A
VLIGLREFQEGKADIIHKYTTEEARNLQSYGELPASAKINQTAIDMAMDDGEEEEDMGFDFDEVYNDIFPFLALTDFAALNLRQHCAGGY